MKKNKKITIFILCIIIILTVILLSENSNADTDKIIEKTEKIAEVSSQTIITTLTAPGEVQSAKTEKLSLNTSYYYLTMCVEKEEYVKKGSNILEYTNGKCITAPYDCVVMEYSVPTAKNICTSNNYITISSVEDLYMDINIGEDKIDKISVGQEVEIVVNYDESKTYTGTISKINAIGTRSLSGTNFAAIASLKNDGNLKLGMSATCTVTIDKKENLPCLPIEAIQIENNNKYVNLADDNKVEVETGVSNDAYIEIKSGIAEGTSVQISTESSSSSNTRGGFTRGSFEGGAPMEIPSGGMPSGGMPSGGPSIP